MGHTSPHIYAADTHRDVFVNAHTSCLRACHSSPERLLGLVLLPVLIVAWAEQRDQYVDYGVGGGGGGVNSSVLSLKHPTSLTPVTFTLST